MRYWSFAILALFLSSSCSVDKEAKINSAPIQVIENQAEPFSVWTSMARASKYNIDQAIKENDTKMIAAQAAKKPVEKLIPFTSEINGKNELFNTYKTLDLAILITQNNPQAQKQVLAQNLMLAGISSYGQASFALKKNLYLERLIKKQERDIAKLTQKEDRLGNLDEKDLENKKSLETFVARLNELQKEYVEELGGFADLEKVSRNGLVFGSRRFFDGTNWDDKLQLEDFEKLALKNGVINNINDSKAALFKAYPKTARISSQDTDYSNPNIGKELIEKNNQIINDILHKKGNINQAKISQIELAFYFVKASTDAQFDIDKKYSEAYSNLKRLQNDNKKLSAILEQQIDVIRLSVAKNKNTVQRAVAIQNLYFTVEPISLGDNFFKADIAQISKAIKSYTASNLGQALAIVESEKMLVSVDTPKHWAEGENWLEELVEPKPIKTTTVTKNEQSMVQIASYEEYKNANDLVKKLEHFPYKPEIERTKLNGKNIYRVIIKSNNNDLEKICKAAQAYQLTCLLR